MWRRSVPSATTASRSASAGVRPGVSDAVDQVRPAHQLKKEAKARLAQLQKQGETKAQLYGADETVLGGLNSFYCS